MASWTRRQNFLFRSRHLLTQHTLGAGRNRSERTSLFRRFAGANTFFEMTKSMVHVMRSREPIETPMFSPAPGARADLGATLKDVMGDLRGAVEAVGAELHVDSFPSTNVACTPGALTSVLSNLIGNAVKYISEGRRVPRRIAVRVANRDK